MQNMPELSRMYNASSKTQSSTPVVAQASTPVSAGKKGRGPRFWGGKPGDREPPFNNPLMTMHKPLTPGAPFLMQQHPVKDGRRIESLEYHCNSTKISNLVMRLLAILKINCDRDDDSILRVVDIIVSIVCFSYDKISKIFETATTQLSELSFHQLSSLFGHSEYGIVLFKELAIIGISEDATRSLYCSTVADPAKNFYYIFAGRIVPSQVKIREMIRKRSQPVVPVVPVNEVQEVQVDPTVLTEQQRKQELHKEFLNVLD